MTESDEIDFPVVDDRFKITHPNSQRPGADVFLANLSVVTFKAIQLPLPASQAFGSQYGNVKWLTSYQLKKRNPASSTGNTISYQVQIVLDPAAPANPTVYLVRETNGTPEVVSEVTRSGNTLSFPLSILDPTVGIGG